MKSICYLSLLATSLLLLAGCHSDSAKAADSAGSKASSTSKLTKLEFKDDKVGDGGEFEYKKPAQTGDQVFMIYSGKLANGSEFDSNTADDKQVFNFTIGNGSVIKGWDQGIPGMKIGGVRELSIPSTLAYGADVKADGKIPPNSDLYFKVTLLDIVPPGTDNQILFDDKKVGTGAEVQKGSKVSIHYSVADLKGNELDANDYSWTVGSGKIYSQIETGIQGMKEGGVRVIRLADKEMLQLSPKPRMQVPADVQLVKIQLKKVS